jgi:hypothetical protein
MLRFEIILLVSFQDRNLIRRKTGVIKTESAYVLRKKQPVISVSEKGLLYKQNSGVRERN